MGVKLIQPFDQRLLALRVVVVQVGERHFDLNHLVFLLLSSDLKLLHRLF